MWQNITCTKFLVAQGVHGTPHFTTLTLLTLALRGISMLFVYYFPTMQFNQSGSSLTDPQKFALTPSFKKRGSIDLQKKEAQETLGMTE